MINIKILGPGCKRCDAVMKLLRDEADRLGVEIKAEKITDYAEIAKFGVASTPGIVIDGKVVHAGGLPKEETIAGWLKG
jgi:small redox-active disulfide protein 2